MSKFLEYKGYLGSLEVDVEEGFVYGRLMFIRDVISYRSEDVQGIKRAFEAAVDDYLQTCRELGEVPDVPCKGTFNVRIGHALHQKIAIAAAKGDVSLNDWVKQACELKLANETPGATAKTIAVRVPAVRMVFEDEQVFGIGGGEEWQPQNHRQLQ